MSDAFDSSLIFSGHWIGSIYGTACEATQIRRRTDQRQERRVPTQWTAFSIALLPLHNRMYRPFERSWDREQGAMRPKSA